MASEKRLIDANALREEIYSHTMVITGLRCGKGVLSEYVKEYKKVFCGSWMKLPPWMPWKWCGARIASIGKIGIKVGAVCVGKKLREPKRIITADTERKGKDKRKWQWNN